MIRIYSVHQGFLKRRRETLFRMQVKKHGVCRCFVCGQPVSKDNWSLEHVVPRRLGGTNHISNLAISHHECNVRRDLEPQP